MDYYDRLTSQADKLLKESDADWRRAQEAEGQRDHARADRLAGSSSTLREASEILSIAAAGVIEDLRDSKVDVPAYQLGPNPTNEEKLERIAYQEGVVATLKAVSELIASKHAAIKTANRRNPCGVSAIGTIT